MESKWRDSFWSLFHILKKDEQFFNELMLLIEYDADTCKRKYSGFINSKKEEHNQLRRAIDELVLGLPEGE